MELMLLINKQGRGKNVNITIIIITTCSDLLISGISVWNPAFDVTPAELITGGIVTEFGVFSPAELKDKLVKALKQAADE